MRAIDGDALMNDINESLNQMTAIGIAVNGEWLWEKLNDAIDNAPTIEPKKGKWIFKEDFRIVDGYDWKCDQCGSWQRYTSNYCPNCGARMEGRDD